MKYPRVIWMGTEPLKGRGRFRLVDRGPARENRPDDVPFSLEQQIGQDMMKIKTWGPPDLRNGGIQFALWALSHAMGQLLSVDVSKLDAKHPMCCEINMAIVEGRESKGCDCMLPADPHAGID